MKETERNCSYVQSKDSKLEKKQKQEHVGGGGLSMKLTFLTNVGVASWLLFLKSG